MYNCKLWIISAGLIVKSMDDYWIGVNEELLAWINMN